MIHIDRSPAGLTVSTISSYSSDHENLSSTNKQTFARIAGAWTNIRAQMREWNSEYIDVQDNTGKVPVVYRYHRLSDTKNIIDRGVEMTKKVKELLAAQKKAGAPKKKAAKKSTKKAARRK